jgi:hypothetical protein
MLVATACQAIRSAKVVELSYDGFSRAVEIHAVGYTKQDKSIMRVWQLSGGSASGEQVGWKILRLEDALAELITGQSSQAPRTGYRKGDPAMARIVCEV